MGRWDKGILYGVGAARVATAAAAAALLCCCSSILALLCGAASLPCDVG